MEKVFIELATQLLPVISTILLTLATAALYRLQQWLKAKYTIDLDDHTRTELNRLAYDAVMFAEELAHGMLKIGNPASSESKERFAVEQLKILASKYNLTDERARALILSALGDQRKWDKD